MWLVVILLVALVGVGLYARLAPSDVARWHVMPERLTPGNSAGQAVRMVEAGPDTFARLDEIILGTPRTEVLAGSVDEGMRTYITRTALFGFPDYTTVAFRGDQITLFGRLRFGKYDMGVNAKRLDGWLSQL
ncbi:DUF1499 domain-containing protein [Roseovarius sp. S88]|uniref:DUF1499 domain-containing protein n=2 Tax=Roseovarius phycicola TaxID=3080976 RepID=A0ABZ2HEI8_9RHOB